MANFQTHITAGVLTSGVLSTTAMAASLVNPRDALFLTVAGTVGSILPDIDLESSRQSKMIFSGFGIFFAFVALFHYSHVLSIAELCLLWIGIYAFIRYMLWRIFNASTTHRGIFHSLLANATFAAAGVVIFFYLLEKSDIVAWLGGVIVFLGAMLHLVLDEMYSIDFNGNRVKRSFGTALKVYDYAKPISSLTMAAVLGGLLYIAPTTNRFSAVVQSKENWAYMERRLLPRGKWFDIREIRAKLAEAAHAEEPETTGSIK